METIDYNVKIIVPILNYELKNDNRYLIPFVKDTKIGFVSRNAEIVIPAQYDYALDDFYHEKSIVRVGNTYAKAYNRQTSEPATYCRNLYGLLKSNGEYLLPIDFEDIIMPRFSNAITIHSFNKGYAVVNFKGEYIIPFGVYNYIDGFDRGYARIKIGGSTNGDSKNDCYWGIIDHIGNIILEPKYINIWNFYNKSLEYTNVVDKDNIFEFHFNDGKLRNTGYHKLHNDQIRRELEEYRSLKNESESIGNWSDPYGNEQAYYNGWSREDVESGLADAYENDLSARDQW